MTNKTKPDTSVSSEIDDTLKALHTPHCKCWHGGICECPVSHAASNIEQLLVKAQNNLLDRMQERFNNHAESIELWGAKGLALDTIAIAGNLNSEQREERNAMVTERRALAVLAGAIKAEKAELQQSLKASERTIYEKNAEDFPMKSTPSKKEVE